MTLKARNLRIRSGWARSRLWHGVLAQSGSEEGVEGEEREPSAERRNQERLWSRRVGGWMEHLADQWI